MQLFRLFQPAGRLLAAASLAAGVAGLVSASPADVKGAEATVAVLDMSEDLVPRMLNGPPSLQGRNDQAALLRLRQGGVSGVILPLHEPRPGVASDMTPETAFLDLERRLAQSAGFYPPGCRSAGNRIRTWLALDGMSDLAKDPGKIPLWILRGVRIFALVGATDNELATSWNDPPPGPVVGLSRRGREIVRLVYDAGGIVDVAAASAMARDDVFAIARARHAPVVAISSNARSLADDPRNLTDTELRSVAESGGVVAASFDQTRVVRGRTATLHDLVRQILHMVRVAGVDHVAIGTGYEDARPPDGLETAARFPVLARALLASGMSHEDVERIFSRNALRILCPVSGSSSVTEKPSRR